MRKSPRLLGLGYVSYYSVSSFSWFFGCKVTTNFCKTQYLKLINFSIRPFFYSSGISKCPFLARQNSLLLEKRMVCLTTDHPWTYIIIHVCACLRNNTQRETFIMQRRLCIGSTKKNVGASRPYLEGRLAFIRQGLVFRLSSTPKRLLAQMDNGLHA